VGPATGAEAAAGDDETLSGVENRALLEPAFRALHERERRILELRFFADLSQVEIARELGISQVHVSRTLQGALEKLRNALGAPEPALTRSAKATNGGPS
jgi:RNA polymerase sigma-B factor